jgi:hypothetical protein
MHFGLSNEITPEPDLVSRKGAGVRDLVNCSFSIPLDGLFNDQSFTSFSFEKEMCGH